MSKLGYNVHLFTIHQPDIENPLDDDIRLHILPHFFRMGYYLNKMKLRKLLAKINPQILHIFYAGGYALLGRLSRFHPTILSVLGTDVFGLPYQSKFKKKMVTKNLYFPEYITSTSYAMKLQTEKLVEPNNPIEIIPFGIDCDIFRPFENIKSHDEIVIGTVKSLKPNYGIEYLIRAFHLLVQRYGDSKKLRLVIAGKGNQEKYLRRLSIELGVSSMTEFLGYVPHSDVPKLLNSFTIFVAVSSYIESFGVSILEASACGLPVVVSNVGGLPEVVIDGKTGIVVPPMNESKTADAIAYLIDNPDVMGKMSENGRKNVIEKYEWKHSVEAMNNLYERILNRSEASR